MLQKYRSKYKALLERAQSRGAAVFGLSRKEHLAMIRQRIGRRSRTISDQAKNFVAQAGQLGSLPDSIARMKKRDWLEEARGAAGELRRFSFRRAAGDLLRKLRTLEMRDWKNLFRSSAFRRAGAVAVLIIFLITNIFQHTLTSQGAQYTFLQSDWSGGATANTAVHPTNSSGWDEFASASNVTTTTPGQATLSETAHENFSETFTATTYKDAVNTTANWNTSAGQVEMATESSGVNLYEKLNGILAGSTINAQVRDGDDYYVGSSSGKFLKYNSATDTATDLTAKISGAPVSWGANTISAMIFDSVNAVIYLGGNPGKFARYNTTSYAGGGTYPLADSAYNLGTKISSFWGSYIVRSFALDSANNVLYLAGAGGNFVRYNTTSYAGGGTYPTADTVYNLNSKIASFWGSDTVNELILDPANTVIYLMGNGSFGKYDIGSDSASEISGKLTSIWGTSDYVIRTLAADGKVYLTGNTTKFFSYDSTSETVTDLSSKVSTFLASYTISSLVYDSANKVIYLGTANSKFIRYNLPSYTGGGVYPAADTAYDLTSKISSFLSGSNIGQLAFDGTDSIVYLGSDNGKLARYNTTFNDGLDATYPTADTAYNLTAKISSFWSTSYVGALHFEASDSTVYIAGPGGKFARYNTTNYAGGGTYPTADTAYDLTAKMSGAMGFVAANSFSSDSANGVLYFSTNTASATFGKYAFGDDTVTNLSGKVNSFFGADYGASSVFDAANGVVYIGTTYGKYARYNIPSYAGGGTYPTADTAYNLTAKISSFLTSGFVPAFDSTNNVLYIGGGNGKFARYNTTSYSGGGSYPDADTGYNLTSKLDGANIWNIAYSINAAAFDSANNTIYLGGASGKFARYNTASYAGGGTYPTADTVYDLTSKISSFFNADIYSLVFDSTNNVLYLGGAGVRFGRYNTTSYAGGGTYPTADTGYNLTAKISSAPISWSTNSISSFVFDSVNNVIYLGGGSGKFARYNTTSYAGGGTYPTADTAYYLSPKVNGIDWNVVTISATVAASGNEIYVGGNSGRFAKYNSETGVATDLTDKIYGAPVSWGTSGINSLVFDSANNVIYLGGATGKFARYNTSSWNGSGTCTDTGSAYSADTACELVAKISGAPVSWSTNIIYAMTFDSANNVLYIGGGNGKFARYNTSSWNGSGTCADTGAAYAADTACELVAKISSFWGTTSNTVYTLAMDAANNAVYLGGGVIGTTVRFARYNTSSNNGLDATYPSSDTAYDLRGKINPAIWSDIYYVNDLEIDPVNEVVYLIGQGGKFARYNTTSYAGGGTYPNADTAYDLYAKVNGFSNGVALISLTLESASNALYVGGATGKFARYSIATDSATNLRSPDTLSWWSTTLINALTLDADGKLYIVGNTGYFAEKPAAASVSYAVSSALDAQSYNIAYATLTKSDTVGTGTIGYQLSNDGGATWETVTPAVNHVFTSVGSDLRFKIAVSGNATVQDIAIEYWAYNPSGELVSSKYNATDATNVLAKMAWTETLPSGTDVKFQIRTASSAVGLDTASWCGPDNGTPGSCNSVTYFTDPAGTETIDDLNNDLTDDQWFQYKAILTTSDGVNTPTLSDATVTYVVNAPPEFQNVTASQGTDGLVTVDYDVRDPDTTTGVTQGVVNVGLQYCTANCGTPGSETWTDATALTGDYGAGLAVQEVNWTSYQLVWDPNIDYAGQYNATDFKIRVKAYDGELANHTGYGDSATFTLDTSDPVLAADTLLINDSSSAVTPESSALTLKLQNVTGDTVTETVYAQFSSDGSTWYGANGNGTLASAGQWGTGFALDDLATLSWPWTMAERSETITVRIKDGYGNLQSTTDTNSSQYNAYPELQTLSASQGADGLVTVNYEVKDTDTALGVTPNAVNITLQYCTANCSDAGNETWTDAVTATGDGAGVSVTGTGWTAHQVVWTVKADYDEEYNATDFKVRVKADDGDTVNELDYLESSSFTLDTKDPTNHSFTIDHTTNELTLATPSDDSSYQMSVSNVAGTFSTFEAFSSPYIYGSMTSDPATVYVRIKDAYGNYTDASATTPARPSNPIFFDISNITQGTYQEFVAWDVVSPSQVGSGFDSYKVYRKIGDGAYSLLSTISDREVNYVLDRIQISSELDGSDPNFDPNNPSTYYYKIVTTDTDGNVSAYSGETYDIPNGTGGSDTTPPTISDVEVTNVNTTSAKVTWTTDELSNSSVGYSPDTAYLPERGLSSMTLNHEIVLTGLTPGTTYNIRVKSYDVAGNLAQNDKDAPGSSPIPNFTFETHPGPAISQVTIPHISNHQATITWKTTTDSSTYVVYSDTVADGALVAPEEVGTPDLVGGAAPYSHTQIISSYQNAELIANTTYYFYVKSIDGSNNVATDDNGGNFYQLLTTEDTDAPVISGVNAAIINNVEAAINWTTDEPATSVVHYGTEEGGPYPETGEVLTYNNSHYVILSGLTADTAYYYTVTSSDINTNEDTSEEYSFTTLNDPAFQHEPISAILNISDPPTVLTDTKAVISFETDQAAECVIEFGTAAGNYNELPVSESGFNESHSMHIPGLIFETTYFYRITCADNLENAVASEEYSFTTLEKQYGETEASGMGDRTAPAISNVASKVLSGESVTVTWTTDEDASSYVNYGIASGTYTDMAGDPLVNNDKTLYDTTHTVTVNGLIPGIEYYFTVLSTDAAGNIGESSESAFTTGTSSSLSSINITSSEMGEALVTWTTDEKTSSIVEYGISNLYGEKKESSTKTTDHSITINGLNAATLYHLRVKGEDEAGQLYSSGDYTFTPKSPPQIGTVVVKDVSEHEATVAFSTDFPTDFTVTYANLSDPADSGSKGRPDLALNHEITLDKLKSGMTYSLKIKASDGQGNSVEKIAQNFTTSKDENAPEIAKTRTESALAQNDKVQTIISWETNELSLCSLVYREGAAGEEREFKVNDRGALSHVAVVTTFKPGTVYYFKIKSVDEAGNESVSTECALLTPQKKENIVQIIINNFQDIFSWVDRV